MAHLVHASKRRRLNDVASTLSRPFKSPLRTSLQKQDIEDKKPKAFAADTKAANDPKDKTTQRSDEVKGQTTEAESAIVNESASRNTTTLADDNDPKSQSPLALTNRNRKLPISSQRQFSSSSSNYTASSSKSDPQLYELQKQHSILQSRLSALRSELDTAQQALRIESSSKDKELEALIVKWRSVGQEAAEELFASAREKVLRMGGVAAWREREKQRREMKSWYDEDEGELEDRKAEITDRVDLNSSSNNDNSQSEGEMMKEMEDEVRYTFIQ